MSNGKSTPKESSKQESKTDTSMMHPSSEIYLPSGVSSLEEWLTSLRQASLVHHSPSPVNKEALMMPETSGLIRSELSVRFDPSTSSWRTYQESLLPPENEEHQAMGQLWSENLPKQGMIVSGKLLELTMSVRHTEERDGSALGSWSTPRVSGQEGYATRVARKGHAQAMSYLEAQAEYIEGTWPTPTATDSSINQARPPEKMIRKDGRNVLRTPSLGETVMQEGAFPYTKQDLEKKQSGEDYKVAKIQENWPTPAARDYKGGSGTIVEKNGRLVRQSNTTGQQYGARLDAVTEQWPTPTAAEAGKISNRANYGQQGLSNHPAIVGQPQREKMYKSRRGDGRSTQLGHQVQQTQNSGQDSSQSDQTLPQPSPKRLNVNFVEWLMGIPIGWTALKPLETESFRQWYQHFYHY